ncbi:hypothetical protein [Methylosinus sp. R-45379]|uniref:hypothetical protein n=1 Tax=Methylosinus sp. R-45379 TaxID=980563 RepID=UPI0007C96C4D|nr:hypothetical protein [Methylosinus sp. R-45379]
MKMAMDWIVETLRVSLFSTHTIDISNADWTKITGQDEAETQKKALGRRTMTGPYRNAILNLSASGNRSDCIVTPRFPTPDAIEENYIPSVGAWPSVCESFVEDTATWVTNSDVSISRIAFGAVLLGRCESREQAYRYLLGSLKSVKGDPERMAEVIFRVNWPLKSDTVENLVINRITQWSVLEVRVQLAIDFTNSTIETAPMFVVRLELDHSTDAQRSEPFDRDSVPLIYRELVQLAFENAKEGELP